MTGIYWGKCARCGKDLYLKRLSGRRPKFCSTCRVKIQNDYKENR